jgi:hypothetical protein
MKMKQFLRDFIRKHQVITYGLWSGNERPSVIESKSLNPRNFSLKSGLWHHLNHTILQPHPWRRSLNYKRNNNILT